MHCLLLNKCCSLFRKTVLPKEERCGFIIKYVRFFFCTLLLGVVVFSCAPAAYKNLQEVKGNAGCVEKFQPVFERALYQTSADVMGNHLGGILLIKLMPDSALRLLFTNETGYKFFDLEFSKTGQFSVHFIIDKMNKEAVIKTLQKDFQLLLFQQPVKLLKPYTFTGQNEKEYYYAYHQGKDYYYYITDNNCSRLIRMERGSKSKKVLDAFTSELKSGMPDSLRIHHTNFKFDMILTRIYDY